MSEDTLHGVLAAQSERFLRALSEEPSVDTDPIVYSEEVLDSEEYVTLCYELHHVILPALASEDVVTFDRRAGEVSRGPAFDGVDPSVDGVDSGVGHDPDASDAFDGPPPHGTATADPDDDDDD